MTKIWIVVLWLAVSVFISGCGYDGTHSNIPNTAGIVFVFNEVYDGNSTLVNTSSFSSYYVNTRRCSPQK